MPKKAQTTKNQKPDAPLVQADEIDEVNVDATIVNNNGKNNQTTVNNVDVEVNNGDDEKEDDNPLINPVPQPIPIAKENLTVLVEAQEDAQAEEDHVNTAYRTADKTDEDVQKKENGLQATIILILSKAKLLIRIFKKARINKAASAEPA